MGNFNLGIFLLAVLPVLLAITVHEAAHGYAARYYGDRTAEQLGRLTLNPLAHIDPIGTIVVPAVMFFTTGFMFGWAKPVPVVTRNLRDTRIGMRMVAIAGPASNFAMMFGWAVLMMLSPLVPESFQYPMRQMATFGVTINAVLFVLNMLPILPLDGGRFVDTFLPAKASYSFRKIEPYGMWILIALLFTGMLNKIMQPFLAVVLGLVQSFIRLLGG
ncbi:site-2 protease family protein [Uruburuella testudinis]|uniref:Site-2 protease family protein n=1 Tax=Uruburuella testudinis TaxID=1282863 RepID=A0ABY4DTW7_9NEIS|nr:site-2 protease family protein [Uruburuella testudinis]UOO81868.1 site-2 protease family protein [Uruburuella testudinis]